MEDMTQHIKVTAESSRRNKAVKLTLPIVALVEIFFTDKKSHPSANLYEEEWHRIIITFKLTQ